MVISYNDLRDTLAIAGVATHLIPITKLATLVNHSNKFYKMAGNKIFDMIGNQITGNNGSLFTVKMPDQTIKYFKIINSLDNKEDGFKALSYIETDSQGEIKDGAKLRFSFPGFYPDSDIKGLSSNLAMLRGAIFNSCGIIFSTIGSALGFKSCITEHLNKAESFVKDVYSNISGTINNLGVIIDAHSCGTFSGISAFSALKLDNIDVNLAIFEPFGAKTALDVIRQRIGGQANKITDDMVNENIHSVVVTPGTIIHAPNMGDGIGSKHDLDIKINTSLGRIVCHKMIEMVNALYSGATLSYSLGTVINSDAKSEKLNKGAEHIVG